MKVGVVLYADAVVAVKETLTFLQKFKNIDISLIIKNYAKSEIVRRNAERLATQFNIADDNVHYIEESTLSKVLSIVETDVILGTSLHNTDYIDFLEDDYEAKFQKVYDEDMIYDFLYDNNIALHGYTYDKSQTKVPLNELLYAYSEFLTDSYN